CRNEAIVERLRERLRVAIAREPARLGQHLVHRATAALGLLHGARDRALIDPDGDSAEHAAGRAASGVGGDAGRRCRRAGAESVDQRVHRVPPASWKMGKYMSTPITPIIRPMKIMSSCSISRVTTATQRASSS